MESIEEHYINHFDLKELTDKMGSVDKMYISWGKELVKSQLIEKDKEIERLSNSVLFHKVKELKRENKYLRALLDSNELIMFIRNSKTNAEARRYWRNKLINKT